MVVRNEDARRIFYTFRQKRLNSTRGLAIDKLKRSTSLGPSGLTTELYRELETISAGILCPIFDTALPGEIIPDCFEQAFSTVLSKCGRAKNPIAFQPICLINGDQEEFAHEFAQRLKTVLVELVSSEQPAYLREKTQLYTDWSKLLVAGIGLRHMLGEKWLQQSIRPGGPNVPILTIQDTADPRNFIILREKICQRITKSFSRNITLHGGVRQICPIADLLVVVAFGPPLKKCSFHTRLSRATVDSTVAEAEEFTVVSQA